MAGTFTKRPSAYQGMPYRGFTDLELLLVENALRLAWTESVKRFNCHKIDFSKGLEDDISSALVMVFDDIWTNNRELLFDFAKLLQPVPEFNSYHGAFDYRGKALNFRPDLTFRRAYTPPGMSALNGCLFIEAKVIDAARTMGTYCSDGLIRFVDGTYAWAMPQALMLGYVNQKNKNLPQPLTKHLALPGKKQTYNLKVGPTAFSLSSSNNPSHITVHERSWTYPETKASPGDIKVLHLWLMV